jgi:tetratricopeptide (TPR) repeat protein
MMEDTTVARRLSVLLLMLLPACGISRKQIIEEEFRKSRMLIERRDTGAAEQRLRRILDLDPENPQAQYLLAQCRIAQRDYEGAADLFNRCIERIEPAATRQVYAGLGTVHAALASQKEQQLRDALSRAQQLCRKAEAAERRGAPEAETQKLRVEIDAAMGQVKRLPRQVRQHLDASIENLTMAVEMNMARRRELSEVHNKAAIWAFQESRYADAKRHVAAMKRLGRVPDAEFRKKLEAALKEKKKAPAPKKESES